MKKKFVYLLTVLFFVHGICAMQEPPQKKEFFKEMATQYAQGLPELFNNLSQEERVFIYYMYRSGLPGNRILTDQNHRHAVKMIKLLDFIVENADKLKEINKSKKLFDVDALVEDVQTYLVYLWTNHGQYFEWENANQKRTPARIGLNTLTKENFVTALDKLGYPNVAELLPSFFDVDFEPTLCVENDIEKSAINMYSPDFTNEDFEQLPEKDRTGINSYFYIEEKGGKRIPKIEKYKIGGKYSDELDVVVYWLKKAHEHAAEYTQYFDQHLIKGLDYLIQYLNSGDEELFKKHSIEWAQQQKNGKVDYTFGYIETYYDPKGNVGSFQGDVTIKSIDMQKLNTLLPSVEKELPFPAKYQREDLSVLPNASVNTIVFSSCPIIHVSAYCLPNYPELRSQYGSKQIMYQLGKDIGQILNPDAHRALFNLHEKAVWLKGHDPEGQLARDIWMVHCILHETLGHGSGRLDVHTFRKGDKLTVGGKTYKVGDTIPVTSENLSELLDGQRSALEELRAEIIALYTSVANFDELSKADLYKDWPQKIGKEKLTEELILDMMNIVIRRLHRQNPNEKEITGAHALANNTIANYIIAHGGASLEQEEVTIDGRKFNVLGYKINDMDKTLASIKALMIKVQELKSTGDGQGARNLIDTYGRYVRNIEDIKIVQENTNFVNQGLKATARVYPRYTPVEKDGKIVDVTASWPSGIVEQWQEFKTLELSKK